MLSLFSPGVLQCLKSGEAESAHRPQPSARRPKPLTRPNLAWGLHHFGVMKDALGTAGSPLCIMGGSQTTLRAAHPLI